MGVTICAATAGAVFLVNLILTVWASVEFGLAGGIGTIQTGSCRKTRNLTLWLHLAINALSTLLLGASNYTMQCLASPTREEIDKAHNRHIWLDIGVPSVRNLRRIAGYRMILWWLLAFSGIPLHLLYNSAVFSTLSSQEYTAFAASPDLVNATSLDWSSRVDRATPHTGNSHLEDFRNLTQWEKIENAACIGAYAVPFVSARGDLLAITSAVNSSVLITAIKDSQNLDWGEAVVVDVFDNVCPYTWICDFYPDSQSTSTTGQGACDANYVLKSAKDWTLGGRWGVPTYPVQYCLSKPIEEHCQVQFSIIIMSIVIVCNFSKAVCMLLALWRQKSQPLVTLGDALEVFLLKPDPTTENMCLAEKGEFAGKNWGNSSTNWREPQHRWFSSASKVRWLTCNIL